VSQIVRLDRPSEAFAFQADPDDAIRQVGEPVLFDEWQRVPGVLGAIKRTLDSDSFVPDRFVLTGSALPTAGTDGWLGTGRVVDMVMYPMSRREIEGRVGGNLFLDRVLGAPLADFAAPHGVTLADYVAYALQGGFPEAALVVAPSHRSRWITGYIARLLTHDVQDLAGTRDADALRRYLTALAANTAGVVSNKTLYEIADIGAATARTYAQLLRNLYLLDAVPPWSTNRLSRLVDMPKRFLIDASLAATLLDLTVETVFADGNMLGRIVETFVMSQLRPEVQVSANRPRLYHLRDKDARHEIDVIAEYGGSRVVAVEVKAGASPDPKDFGHLRWLRDILGDRFVRGVLLHTGPLPVQVDDRIIAAPIATIWR